MTEREQHKNRRRRVGAVREPPVRKSPGVGGTEHDPLPFEQRYRRAVDNAPLRRNLPNFQRSWRVSRHGACAAYEDNPARVAVQPPARQADNLPVAWGTDEYKAMRDSL